MRTLFREAVIAELVSVSLLIPLGHVFGFLVEPVSQIPAPLVLIPPVLGLKGRLVGILCARITTALHLGTVEPRFRGNTEFFKANLRGYLLLTVFTSLFLGLLAYFLSVLFEVKPPSPYWHSVLLFYFLTAFFTVLLATTLAIPVTLTLAFQSFRRGLDPDVLVYPATSSSTDFLVSLSLLVVVKLLTSPMLVV